MGKGAIDDRSHLSLMAVGLQARDHVLSGFDRADLVICVGYDLVEYAPAALEPGRPQADHPHRHPAGRGRRRSTSPRSSSIGDIEGSLRRLLAAVQPRGISGRDAGERHAARETLVHADLRTALLAELAGAARRRRLPITPQRAIADLRRGARPRRTSSSRDVGAHKVWVARLYQAYEPNTVIISNGFAAMGSRPRGRSRPSSRPPRPEGRSRCAATTFRSGGQLRRDRAGDADRNRAIRSG